MMRRVLFLLSGNLPCRIINDGGNPYLERYYVGRIFFLTFYLHRFVGSDPDRGLHDHPWHRAYSFILAGFYDEITRAGVQRIRWFNRLTGDSFHRVVLPDGMRDVWTLFCHGPYIKSWGFLRETTTAGEPVMTWVPHLYDKGETGGAQRWWENAPNGWREPRRMKDH